MLVCNNTDNNNNKQLIICVFDYDIFPSKFNGDFF